MRQSITLLILFFIGTNLIAQAHISGKLTEEDTGEPLIFANVVAFQNGVQVTGAQTDFDGNYSLIVDPGTYDIEISYVGFPTRRITGVIAKTGGTSFVGNSINQQNAFRQGKRLGTKTKPHALPKKKKEVLILKEDEFRMKQIPYGEKIKF